MTAAQFRQLALSFPETIESEHMNHPDFRVGGKIFATLSPGEEFGVLLLTPEEQQEFIIMDGNGFSPVPGGWGRKGSTRVHLDETRPKILKQAMAAAWRKRAPARLKSP